ncbi:MAG: hypothetical protein HOW73_20220 [Polyangiaceae bacterium]|nr:hypothetical protein [Polyangiaceae bacterium]
MKPYNTADGIETYLTDLDGLHRLIRERQAAYYDRKEALGNFIVQGRAYFDSCGNFGRCTFEHDYRTLLDWMPETLPRVVRPEVLNESLTKLVISYGISYAIPTVDHVCAECGRVWTIADWHDSVAVRGQDHELASFRHVRCDLLRDERESLREIQQIANDAGLEGAFVVPIPTEYDRSGRRTWALLCTPWGDIKVGWRKRVINIDWSDVVERACAGHRYEARERLRSVFDGTELFKNQETTKEQALVHAWSAAKAAEYLREIHSVARDFGR